MKTPTPHKLPSGQWRIQLQIDGKRRSITRPSKRECINAAQYLKAAGKAGLLDEDEPEPSSPTIASVMTAYIDNRVNVLSPSTVNGYRSIARTRFLAHAATPISTADWQAVINAEALTCSPKTLKNAWGFLKAALSEHGISPAVTLPAQRKTEKAWLTPEQIQTFLVAAHDAPGELGALLALSSLRRSEIYGLTWDDVDLKRGVIHVHQSRVMDENNQLVIRSQNKTAASTRDVPIFLPRLRELLCQPHEPGPVITAAIGTLYDQINTICARARLPAVGVHGLRHSFASLCYSIGLNELQCMRIGGWSDYGTMRKVYTHLSQRDADTGAEKLQQWFENAHENAHAANEPA